MTYKKWNISPRIVKWEIKDKKSGFELFEEQNLNPWPLKFEDVLCFNVTIESNESSSSSNKKLNEKSMQNFILLFFCLVSNQLDSVDNSAGNGVFIF
jgi:hypothetical protein